MMRQRPTIRCGGVLLAVLLLGAASVSFGQDKSEAPAVTAGLALKISGYTQLLYTAQDSGLDGFTLRRARLSLSGEILKNVRFKLQLDAVKSPILLDAAIEFGFHEAATLRIGQFKVPFSIEMLTSSGDLDTINRSTVVNSLSPGLDIGSSGRDIGAVLFGRVSFLEYTVGVYNGAGINKADTNEEKDMAGRVVVHPTSFLAVGASLYDGSSCPSAGAPSEVRDRAGVDVALLHNALSLKAEFIQAEDGDTVKRGWYVQGGYAFLPKTLQGIVKIDSYDKDTAVAGDRRDVWTLGLNWFLAGRTKLQVNFELTRDESGKTANKALLAHFQAAF